MPPTKKSRARAALSFKPYERSRHTIPNLLSYLQKEHIYKKLYDFFIKLYGKNFTPLHHYEMKYLDEFEKDTRINRGPERYTLFSIKEILEFVVFHLNRNFFTKKQLYEKLQDKMNECFLYDPIYDDILLSILSDSRSNIDKAIHYSSVVYYEYIMGMCNELGTSNIVTGKEMILLLELAQQIANEVRIYNFDKIENIEDEISLLSKNIRKL